MRYRNGEDIAEAPTAAGLARPWPFGAQGHNLDTLTASTAGRLLTGGCGRFAYCVVPVTAGAGGVSGAVPPRKPPNQAIARTRTTATIMIVVRLLIGTSWSPNSRRYALPAILGFVACRQLLCWHSTLRGRGHNVSPWPRSSCLCG